MQPSTRQRPDPEEASTSGPTAGAPSAGTPSSATPSSGELSGASANSSLLVPAVREAARRELFSNLARNRTRLEQLAKRASDASEDGFYRFYHRSFKVYLLQDLTSEMVAALAELAPVGTSLADSFTTIISEGTGKVFDITHNRRWLAETRPIVEAFTHASYMITAAARLAASGNYPEGMIPSIWAALTSLYGIR